MIKWKLINLLVNHLIKNKKIFWSGNMFPRVNTIDSNLLKLKDLFGKEINNSFYLSNQIGSLLLSHKYFIEFN